MHISSGFAAAILICVAGVAQADLKITHEVIGNPAAVEVQDLDNPQVIKRFNLERGESKTVSITGLRVKVKVSTKGTGKLMTEGEFPSSTRALNIQQSGGGWVLKKGF